MRACARACGGVDAIYVHVTLPGDKALESPPHTHLCASAGPRSCRRPRELVSLTCITACINPSRFQQQQKEGKIHEDVRFASDGVLAKAMLEFKQGGDARVDQMARHTPRALTPRQLQLQSPRGGAALHRACHPPPPPPCLRHVWRTIVAHDGLPPARTHS